MMYLSDSSSGGKAGRETLPKRSPNFASRPANFSGPLVPSLRLTATRPIMRLAWGRGWRDERAGEVSGIYQLQP